MHNVYVTSELLFMDQVLHIRGYLIMFSVFSVTEAAHIIVTAGRDMQVLLSQFLPMQQFSAKTTNHFSIGI